MVELNSAQVWEAIDDQLFAVVGMVSARGEARTAGIVYVVDDHRLYFASGEREWKIRHIRANPSVSVTIVIPKRVPLIPWIKVPAATITFAGSATVLDRDQVPSDVMAELTRGIEVDESDHVVVEIVPAGDFVTYGVGVSLLGMRDTVNARGRVDTITS